MYRPVLSAEERDELERGLGDLLRGIDRKIQWRFFRNYGLVCAATVAIAFWALDPADAFVTCDGCGTNNGAYGSQKNTNAGNRSEPRPGKPVFQSCGGSCQAKGNNYGDGTRSSNNNGRNSAPGK